MTLGSLASLIIAGADFRAVDSVVSAMRAADANTRAANEGRIPPVHPAPQREDDSCWRSCDTPTGNTDLRRDTLPQRSPCYLPCPVSRWHPPEMKQRLALAPDAFNPRCESADAPDHRSPIQPPWATLPWRESAHPIVRVKVVQHRTDIVTKGSLIDLFI